MDLIYERGPLGEIKGEKEKKKKKREEGAPWALGP